VGPVIQATGIGRLEFEDGLGSGYSYNAELIPKPAVYSDVETPVPLFEYRS
jgi:hypothetical protein